MSDIEGRKRQHIDAVLNEDVSSKGLTTGFEDYRFDHVALPETDLDGTDLTTSLFGKRLAAPLLLSSMTGGTGIARNINLHLAEAAQSLGIAMGSVPSGLVSNILILRKRSVSGQSRRMFCCLPIWAPFSLITDTQRTTRAGL